MSSRADILYPVAVEPERCTLGRQDPGIGAFIRCCGCHTAYALDYFPGLPTFCPNCSHPYCRATVANVPRTLRSNDSDHAWRLARLATRMFEIARDAKADGDTETAQQCERSAYAALNKITFPNGGR